MEREPIKNEENETHETVEQELPDHAGQIGRTFPSNKEMIETLGKIPRKSGFTIRTEQK